MAEKLDPKDLVTLDELALSNMWETSALVELLERKGILTKQDMLDMIHELRRRHPEGTTLERPPRTPQSRPSTAGNTKSDAARGMCS